MGKRINIGELVLVNAGNDKGKTGKVIGRKGDRVTVQGVNILTKHLKPQQSGQPGKKVTIEGSIHVSNVNHCSEDGERIRLKAKIDSEGNKQYYYIKNDKEVIYQTTKKSI